MAAGGPRISSRASAIRLGRQISQKGANVRSLHCLRLRLPNHLHTIISSVDANLSDIIRDFKRFTSESITDLIHKADNRHLLDFFAEAARLDKRGNRFKIWQGGSHPEAIETGGFFDQKLRYIHENPVRKGFVKNPEDWLYSSARNYYLHDDSVIKIDCLD